jgi:DNA-binding MarR family transcriptional regulator
MDTPPSLPAQSYALIQQIFLLGDDLDRRLLQGFGLSVARFNLLRHLAGQGPLSPGELCGLLLCDKANVTRLLDGLEQATLVERTPHPGDGRRSQVSLTPAGRARLQQAALAYQASVQARFDCLSSDQKLTLSELLQLLKSALQANLRETTN